jgi:hypothetical protein
VRRPDIHPSTCMLVEGPTSFFTRHIPIVSKVALKLLKSSELSMGAENSNITCEVGDLLAALRKRNNIRLGLIFERFLQQLRDSRLTFGYPCGVMLPHNLLGVPK